MIAHLGLGSNVGDRRAHLQAAVDALPGQRVRVLAVSSLYETEPVGEVLDQRAFLNGCLRVGWDGDVEALLAACKAVEREVGRVAGGARHGPREIDVDLLVAGPERFSSPTLAVPHPLIAARRFVLVPLLELDPGLVLPGLGTAADALAALPEGEQEVALAGPPLNIRH